MKTLTCSKPYTLIYTDTELPSPAAGESLLKIKRIGICGTDLHAYEGTQPYFNYPRILGHELSAEIISTDAKGFSQGDVVTILPYFNCGDCIACRAGKPNCCVNLKVYGVHVNGGMREHISIPSHALVHGNGLTADELALVEPLAVGAHGIKRAQVKRGESVLVVGAGPIGLGAMQFAKLSGAQVIAMDTNGNRLKFCRDKLDVVNTINVATQDTLSELQRITKGDMPTVVIDATGNLSAINNAFNYMAHSGRYVLIGLQKDHISFSHPEFHKREGTLMSSRNATRQDFEEVIAFIKNGKIDPGIYITHKVNFEDVASRFGDWLNPKTNVIKAMVTM